MTDPTTAEPEVSDDAEREPLNLLRRVSIVEALSFLILLAATVVKRTGGTELGVEVLGPIHGILFIAYALLIIVHHRLLNWSLWKVLGAIFLGAVPLGGFFVERRWLQVQPSG